MQCSEKTPNQTNSVSHSVFWLSISLTCILQRWQAPFRRQYQWPRSRGCPWARAWWRAPGTRHPRQSRKCRRRQQSQDQIRLKTNTRNLESSGFYASNRPTLSQFLWHKTRRFCVVRGNLVTDFKTRKLWKGNLAQNASKPDRTFHGFEASKPVDWRFRVTQKDIINYYYYYHIIINYYK